MLNAISTVAVSAPENGMPVPGDDRIPGFTTTMYAIVTNVVTPPAMSASSGLFRVSVASIVTGRDATIPLLDDVDSLHRVCRDRRLRRVPAPRVRRERRPRRGHIGAADCAGRDGRRNAPARRRARSSG